MMRWRPLSVVIALVAGLVVVAAPAGAGAAPTNPAPDVVPGLQQWTGSTGRFEFGLLSRIVVADPALLADARSFADDLRGVAGVQLPVVSGHSTHRGDIAIKLGASGLPAQGYALSIGGTVTIAGVDPTGAFYAEQTVEQQVLQDGSLPRGEARDWPDVGQRGFMLDMGRHYYSPAYVEREIRTAAWHKLDVVHLHLTEYNAFRLQSSTYPGLAAAQSYSHADLSAFVATARRYHVTLVPEIDLPAHSTAIADYDPTLKFDCASLADGFTLDVTKPQTMTFLVGLLKEFMPLFPDSPVFHLGGDEYAGLAAQQACPELVAYAKVHGFGSTEDVFVDFLNKLGGQVQALGKRPEIWNWWDVVGGATISPDKNLIIDAWTGTADSYLAAGYDTVSSPDNLLYVTPSSPPGGAIEPNDQYLYESWVPPTDPHLLGFEVSRWSDNAFDQPDSYFDWFANRPDAVLAARTWGGPRAASVFAFEDAVDRIGTPPGVPEYGPPDATLLHGTPYGTSPAYGNSSDTFDKVFDGDPSTFFDYSQADGGYAGIDLGHPTQVVKIRFVARANQPARAIGGVFQGCTDGPTSGCRPLATVAWKPSYEWLELPVYDQTRYRWLRYVSPDGGFANIAEVQFYGPAPSPVSVVVSAPTRLPALGDNTISATVTNTSNRPLLGVGGSLQVTSRNDDGLLQSRPVSGGAVVLLPRHSTTLRWRVDVPLDAPATDYGVIAQASWLDGRTQGYGSSAVPAPLTATLTPPVAQVDAGASGHSMLRVTSAAGAPVRVSWHTTPPAGSGVTVTPASGSFTVAAGRSASAALTATAGPNPGATAVPITLTATGGGQTVPLSTATLSVSVPYPNFPAAYGNIAITDDSDINPSGLNGGIDGDGSSLSAQQLAGIGITPGGTVSHGGFTFGWPASASGQPDNVLADGQTIELTGSGHALGLLTTGTYSPPAGTITVTYTDGTAATASISDPDWQAAPPAGSDVAITTTYHNYTGSGRVNRNAYLYLHTVTLDPTKTVASVTLPTIGDHTTGGTPALHVFGLAIA